ncbi:hypothetical protein JOQ06_027690 [Pogonophryne albipinna]|uniref:SH3 domain-containing protein n=1 Tax=Pogonophryne albipinna TaxID=1090488 RepID=A0AAD6A9S9_9TELE|nr:hypothetical protein JOQ06_027690 [Pogonophryne albipinna]
MFRSNSPFDNDTSSYAGSIQSNGFSNTDDVSSQASNVSKLSAMSVYLQRKEYAESVNKMMDKLRYRVEHLFTCDLDGKELRGVGDCVERLKLLDGMGQVWGQNMRLEVRGANLLLTDRETKEELESMSFSDILELKAVLDAGVFNSLLTVSVRPEGKHTTTVFMFQCEDVRADYVQRDLSAALSRRKHDLGISSNAGPIARHQGMENLSYGEDFSEPKEQKPPQWTAPDYEEHDVPEPQPVPSTTEEEPLSSQRPYTDLDRNVDILNHILALDGMPPAAEFEECFHKIKCGFNLVGELNGRINNPSAPEFVHSLFSILTFLVSHCPEHLLKTIVAPLLTPQCIRLLSEEASTEEDQLWQSLGDAWNIPSTQWPEDDEDIPTYTLEFSDGWQAPEVTAAPEPSEPMRREERQQPAPYQAPAKSITPAHRPKKSSRFVQSPPRDMYVTYDFISRNQRELTVRKGEVVQLLDMSKQWWKVRDSAGQEGYVPNNVLEVYDEQQMEAPGGPPVLTKKSKPAEVKAWLEDKALVKCNYTVIKLLS